MSDRDVDLIVASNVDNAQLAVVVYLNDGTGQFTNATGADATVLLPGLGAFQRLSVDLFDFDLDSDLDLYVTGRDFGTGPNQLFENQLIP